MKKYVYNLQGKESEYTLKEIAQTLDLDEWFLRETLEEKKFDLDIALMTSVNEKNKKKAIFNLLDLYPTRYICSNNLNELINTQLEIKNNKRRFLNTLTYVSKYNDNDYVVLNKRSLNTLLVNTEDDINKKVMTEKKLNTIKSLKALVDSNEMDDCCTLQLRKDSMLHSVKKDFNDDSISISVGDTKKILYCLSNYKLPSCYNAVITEELKSDMRRTDSNSSVYAYVK